MNIERTSRKVEFSSPPIVGVLEHFGIEIPFFPQDEGDIPGKWLIRSENSIQALTGEDRSLLPKSGNFASCGVFLGDCLSQVPLDRGVFFVFPLTAVSSQWLVEPSSEWDLWINKVAGGNGLDLKRVGDYYKAAKELFENHDVYQPKKGIFTSCRPLPIDRASLIAVSFPLIEAGDGLIKALPQELKSKVVAF